MNTRDRRRPGHDERRSQRRASALELPSLAASLSGGARVTLLDISLGGVRLETTRHMRPGQTVSVRFSVDAGLITIAATVVRAAVVHVGADEVRYETGMRLADDIDCEALQVALLERRRCLAERPDADRPGSLSFAHVDAAADVNADSHGWWVTQVAAEV